MYHDLRESACLGHDYQYLNIKAASNQFVGAKE